MTITVAEDWVERPLRRFVDDARVRFALLLHPSGHVLGQHGFTRRVDVMGAAALAVAISAAGGQLGRELDGHPFRELHYAGSTRQIYLADLPAGRRRYVFLTVFDSVTSLGLVQLYFRELRAEVERVQPEPAAPGRPERLEQELDRNLALLFGWASDDRTPPPTT